MLKPKKKSVKEQSHSSVMSTLPITEIERLRDLLIKQSYQGNEKILAVDLALKKLEAFWLLQLFASKSYLLESIRESKYRTILAFIVSTAHPGNDSVVKEAHEFINFYDGVIPSAERLLNGLIPFVKDFIIECSKKTIDEFFPDFFIEKIKRLQKSEGISDDLQKIIYFFMVFNKKMHIYDIFRDGDEIFKVYKDMANLLGIQPDDVLANFSKDSPFFLLPQTDFSESLGCILVRKEFLSDKFIMLDHYDPSYEEYFDVASSGSLSLENFSYMNEQCMMIKNHIAESLNKGKKGVNILLYGPPGIGKTELVKLLATELAMPLLEIKQSFSEKHKNPVMERFLNYVANIRHLNYQKVCVLFDEFNEVLSGGFFSSSVAAQKKAHWIYALENNPVPVFWLANDVNGLDEAIARRFDIVLEMKPLPRHYLKPVLDKVLEDCVSESTLQYVLDNSHISLPMIEKAKAVLSSQSDVSESAEKESTFVNLLNGVLTIQSNPKIMINGKKSIHDFNPDWINCNQDMRKLADILATKNASLLLSGEPGTGKTAYGLWLSKQLDKPMIIKKVSDIEGMYVGETEKNIAQAFAEATDKNAILQFDEVDSYLLARSSANAPWYASATNEFLMQIENFSGILLASTNRISDLDSAVFRRFDFKLNFYFLKQEQLQLAFMAKCQAYGIAVSDAVLKMLHLHDNVAMGDFMVLDQKHRFEPFQSAEQVYGALLAELSCKEAPRMRIGF